MPTEPVPVLPVGVPASEGANRQAAARAVARSVRAGRPSSMEEDPAAASPLNFIRAQYAQLAYQMPWEILDYVELLSTYNPDFSQAVDNIRTLANSGHELFVDGTTTETAAALKERLQEKARTIEERNGGIDGLIDKLLDQAATYGAMCGEWVLNDSLNDVVNFSEVNPKHIRFFWNPDANEWMPFQKVTMMQAKEAEAKGQEVRLQSYVALNPNTFFYYAFDAAPGSPYGVPPYVAALSNIAIQRDMITNMAQIVKKVGLLGIIDFVVKALPMDPGETDEEYSSRANQYLDDYVQAIENMVRDGGIVHFDDSEAKTYQITGNAAGATAIFKQNEELIFSGLKSMPSVQGRSYSTTETYAGVAYDIIIRNTVKYQRACKRMIERGYWLMAQAWGLAGDATTITLTFNSNKTLHRLQDAQSEIMEIKNSLMLWAAGIIDQIGMAQRHGFDSVKTEYDTPPDSAILGNASPGGGAGSTSTDDQVATNDTQAQSMATRAMLVNLGKRVGTQKASKAKRRAGGQAMAKETLSMQEEYYQAGLKRIQALQDQIMAAVGADA